MTRDKPDSSGEVAGGHRIADRLVHRPRLSMPATRALVQRAQQARLGPGEVTAQHLREETVITEPLPDLVERHDEQVLPVQDADNLRRVGRPDDGIAERRAETAENGRPREELADVGRLAAEHLLGQEVGDKPVVAAELADESARRGVAAKGERREVQTGRPPLGPLDQRGKIGDAELGGGGRLHQQGRLGRREAQLASPELDHLASCPEPRYRQRRIIPRDQHDLNG
ncbi:MAG: hypothetical protein ACRDOH_03980 [Streptosporangiaceae bacterium]